MGFRQSIQAFSGFEKLCIRRYLKKLRFMNSFSSEIPRIYLIYFEVALRKVPKFSSLAPLALATSLTLLVLQLNMHLVACMVLFVNCCVWRTLCSHVRMHAICSFREKTRVDGYVHFSRKEKSRESSRVVYNLGS